MGQPVVHFEIIGADPDSLRAYLDPPCLAQLSSWGSLARTIMERIRVLRPHAGGRRSARSCAAPSGPGVLQH